MTISILVWFFFGYLTVSMWKYAFMKRYSLAYTGEDVGFALLMTTFGVFGFVSYMFFALVKYITDDPIHLGLNLYPYKTEAEREYL